MVGKHLGHFEIAAKLGEGGMGVVYEAIDRHLDRHVALKILPAEKVADPARKQRFVQEAKAASALNHPNIVTIYDIASAEGVDYIAMELVSGRTLEDLMRRRRLKVAETLKYTVQVADALAAAHAAGIVHRDLKPANLMITESGLVKVLDFGLAKLTDRSELADEDTTQTQPLITDEGTVVGSAAYMSPEQAEGRKVDARSDIFSFGVLLYEMLSGKRAFRGESRMATMAAVLNQEPVPLSESAPDLPKELERIVARCLRKDLARRSQSMAEIKIALDELKEETASGSSASSARKIEPPARRWRWAVFALVALALAGVLFSVTARWREASPPLKELPLTSYNGSQGEPTLSPDGSQFAFVWDGGQENTTQQLYVSVVGKGTPLRLTNMPGAAARAPSWSPDGQTIAFVRQIPGNTTGDIILIPALGGPERKLDEGFVTGLGSWAPGYGGVSWSPDGKWVYFCAFVSPQMHAIFVEPSAGGEKRRLFEPPAGSNGDLGPSVSPDGRQLVFTRHFADHNEELFVADLLDGITAGAPRRLTLDKRSKSSPVWTSDSESIIYVAGEPTSLLGIYRVRASGGSPVRMEGIGGDYPVSLAISSKGHRLVYGRSQRDYNIWRMPLASDGTFAGAPAKFISSTRYEVSPAYSPDGKRVAFSSNRGGVRQIWVADADGSNPVALTNFTGGVAGSPKWSPDAHRIVFDARPEGFADIYVINADGGTPKRLTDHVAENHLPCFSADGGWVYFASTRSGERQIYRVSADGGEVKQVTHAGGWASSASPDGKWIFYSKARGDFGLWKMPAAGGEESQVPGVASLYNNFSFWVASSGVYFAGAPDPVSRTIPLKLYRYTDDKIVELGRIEKPLALFFTVSPDEKWLAYTQLDSSLDDLILVENFR